MGGKAQSNDQAFIPKNLLFIPENGVGELRVKGRECFWLRLARLHNRDVERIIGVACPYKRLRARINYCIDDFRVRSYIHSSSSAILDFSTRVKEKEHWFKDCRAIGGRMRKVRNEARLVASRSSASVLPDRD